MPHRVLASLTALALFASSVPAHAAQLMTGLGGPAGFGVNFLDYNDDSSSSSIDLRTAFPEGLRLWGETFNAAFVNNNGNVTFGGPVGQYTPSPFPIAQQRMLAVYWADVDTRGGGRPSHNGVYWDVRPGQFVVTWHNVGYYGTHDDRQNSFQIIVRGGQADDDGVFTVEYRYNRCEWTTGDASGGHNGFGGNPAQAGFDAGNRRDYLVLPGSRTRHVLDLCRRSNVGEPGVFRFTFLHGRPRAAGH